MHCSGNWVFYRNVMEGSLQANIHDQKRLHRRCLGLRDKKELRAFGSRSTEGIVVHSGMFGDICGYYKGRMGPGSSE